MVYNKNNIIIIIIIIMVFIEGAQLAKAVFSGALFISCICYLIVLSQRTCFANAVE